MTQSRCSCGFETKPTEGDVASEKTPPLAPPRIFIQGLVGGGDDESSALQQEQAAGDFFQWNSHSDTTEGAAEEEN